MQIKSTTSSGTAGQRASWRRIGSDVLITCVVVGGFAAAGEHLSRLGSQGPRPCEVVPGELAQAVAPMACTALSVVRGISLFAGELKTRP
jgi:hypothetical protein